MINLLYFLSIFILSPFVIIAQSEVINNYKNQLQNSEISDTLRVDIYSNLCWEYRNSSIDSALHYGSKALSLANQINYQKGIAQAHNDIGIIHYSSGQNEEALRSYRKSLSIRKLQNDSVNIAKIYNKISICFHQISKFDSTIYYNYKALDLFDRLGASRYALLIKGNIASVYFKLKQYQKALDLHLELNKELEKINDTEGLTTSYLATGNAYLSLTDTNTCVKYYNKGIKLAKKHGYKRTLTAFYNNYGLILENLGKNAEAIGYYKNALAIRKTYNDNRGIASCLFNLGSTYLTMNKIKQSENYLLQSLTISEELKAFDLKINIHKRLAYLYGLINKPQAVKINLIQYEMLYDSLNQIEVKLKVAELTEKYDAEKKEKEIIAQKEILLQNELEIKNKDFYNLLFGGGILLIALFSLSYFGRQKRKRKQLLKEMDFQEQLSIIKTQNELQEQRINISRDLHDNIGAQLTFIISSVENLKYLSKNVDAKLKNKLNSISEFSKETIVQLRDTIWAMNNDEITIDAFNNRIVEHMEKARNSYPNILFKINNKIKINEQFTSIQGINLYRVVQEAINNSLKYADASEIIINLTENREQIMIDINDNGKGFALETVTKGNGLRNMQKRMSEMNGNFKITSNIDHGTRIYLSIKSVN